MKKIPTALVRNPDDRAHVLDHVTSGCEWVFAGEGVATRKYDGTCVMFDGTWWARREVKPGKMRPLGFRLEELDGTTGKSFGWEPMMSSPFSKFWAEAATGIDSFEPGTYELIGPKINGNPEKCEKHELVRHDDADVLPNSRVATTASARALVSYVGESLGWEGIVWHHPDGRMAKLKARDLSSAVSS